MVKALRGKKEWRRMPPLFLLFPLLVTALPTHAESWSPYGGFWVEGHSDAFPLADIWRGLGKNFRHGENHVALGRAEAGLRRGHRAVGFVWRYETHVKSSRDTTELIWRTETDAKIPADRDWRLRLNVQQVALRGINLSHAFSGGSDASGDNAWTLTMSLQLLQATDMLEGNAHGQIATHDDDYQGQLGLTYYYTRDSLLDRPTDSRQGHGAGLDMQLGWRLNEKHAVQLILRDALNGIYWRDMHYTRANMTSDRISYDEDGNLNVAAALTGFEGNKSHWQRLPVKASLAWRGDIALPGLSAQHFSAEGVWIGHYQDLRLHWFLPPALSLPGLYVTTTAQKAVGFGYAGKKLQLALRVDALPSKARTAGVSFSWGTAADAKINDF